MSSRFFTSSEAGKTFGASPRTASSLIDSGELKGFRLPGTNARRVSADVLREFLIQQKIPLTEFELILAAKTAREDQSLINRKLNR